MFSIVIPPTMINITIVSSSDEKMSHSFEQVDGVSRFLDDMRAPTFSVDLEGSFAQYGALFPNDQSSLDNLSLQQLADKLDSCVFLGIYRPRDLIYAFVERLLKNSAGEKVAFSSEKLPQMIYANCGINILNLIGKKAGLRGQVALNEYSDSFTDETLAGLAKMFDIVELDATSNPHITTVKPFAKTLQKLYASGEFCGIDDEGLASATNLKFLDASKNLKIKSVMPFAASLTTLRVTDFSGLNDASIAPLEKLSTLNCSNNPAITTIKPFIKTLKTLITYGKFCGITKAGLEGGSLDESTGEFFRPR